MGKSQEINAIYAILQTPSNACRDEKIDFRAALSQSDGAGDRLSFHRIDGVLR
jgi:hypothetical protein